MRYYIYTPVIYVALLATVIIYLNSLDN